MADWIRTRPIKWRAVLRNAGRLLHAGRLLSRSGLHELCDTQLRRGKHASFRPGAVHRQLQSFSIGEDHGAAFAEEDQAG